jgi:hypothetical protein
MANKVHHRHWQLQVVLSAALHYLETGAPCHIAVAGAIHELVGANGFGPGFSADDALGNPATIHANIYESRVQQKLDVAAQQQLLEHYGQNLMVENRLRQRNGAKPGEVRKDFVEDFALSMYLATEVGHAAGCHIAASDGETFDQYDLCAGAGGSARSRHACYPTAYDGDIGFVPHRHVPAPLNMRQ